MKQLRVTQEQFATICSTLLILEAEGHDPKTCSREAFKRAGVAQPTDTVEIVIGEVMQS
jgi:ribosome biogenesis protein Tsr3